MPRKISGASMETARDWAFLWGRRGAKSGAKSPGRMIASDPRMQGTEQSYYRGALSLLRFVEERSGSRRRFGAEADATWRQFQGQLGTADRIHLLLADAHAQWPGAVGASAVCQLPGVSEDDAFGPDWEQVRGRAAEELWREVNRESPPQSLRESLAAIASAWKLKLSTVTVPKVNASSRILVAGPSAIAALIEHFGGTSDLDWARQVTPIATPPGHRQLAAAAGVLLNLTVPVPLVSRDQAPKKRSGAVVFVSDDAAAEDAEALGR